MTQNWMNADYHVVYRRFQPDDWLVSGLEQLAREEGIREATITSCIGSLKQLNLRNLCGFEEDVPEFQRHSIEENLELVSAEGYVQPLPDGGIRIHIHLVAARPSGELIGGHCEEARIFTGAFMYLHIIDAEGKTS